MHYIDLCHINLTTTPLTRDGPAKYGTLTIYNEFNVFSWNHLLDCFSY